MDPSLGQVSEGALLARAPAAGSEFCASEALNPVPREASPAPARLVLWIARPAALPGGGPSKESAHGLEIGETVPAGDLDDGCPRLQAQSMLLRAFTAPVSERMVRDLKPGQRVLDIASGTGEPALEAAARVGPSGGVVGSDFVPEMLEFASGEGDPTWPDQRRVSRVRRRGARMSPRGPSTRPSCAGGRCSCPTRWPASLACAAEPSPAGPHPDLLGRPRRKPRHAAHGRPATPPRLADAASRSSRSLCLRRSRTAGAPRSTRPDSRM